MTPKFIISLISLSTMRKHFYNNEWWNYLHDPDLGLKQDMCDGLWRYLASQAISEVMGQRGYSHDNHNYHDSWKLVYKSAAFAYKYHCLQLVDQARIPVAFTPGLEARVMVLDDVAVLAYQILA